MNRFLALNQGNKWYRIRNTAGAGSEVYIYDDIGVWGVTADDFRRDIQALTTETLDVHVSSRGGDVFEGIAIHNALKAHPAKVNIIVDSIAASISSVIAMAGDVIKIQRNAQMMIHDASSGLFGNAADMQEMAELLDKTSNNIASIYANRAGGEVEEWRNRMRAETWYNSQEAVEAGLADAVVGGEREARPEKESEAEPVAAKWDGQKLLAALKEAL